MIDDTIILKMGIRKEIIDCDKSYMSFDVSSNYNIIELYLKKDNSIICPLCNSSNSIVRSTKTSIIKTSAADMHRVKVRLHRRMYKCCNGHNFMQVNPFYCNSRTISDSLDTSILFSLKDKGRTYTAIAEEYGVSPTYVVNLFDTKVDMKRQSLPPVLCIDEVYARKLTYKSYCCVLYSPQWKKIIDVLSSRQKIDLVDYFSRIPKEEKDKVQFISMDLYESYRQMAKLCLPKAKISADPFHVVKNLNVCFQRIRIETMNKYAYLKNENSNYYWLFKKFWKFLVMDISKLPDGPIRVSKSGSYMTKYQIIEHMLNLNPKLRLAYELKEEYRTFVAKGTIDNAESWLNELIVKFKDAHIPEYSTFIKIMEGWHDEIINSFNVINGHKISNGAMERVNKDIKFIFAASFGSTNFNRIRNRIMYCINYDASISPNRTENNNKREGKPRGTYKKNN